jgi:hypothetical protein
MPSQVHVAIAADVWPPHLALAPSFTRTCPPCLPAVQRMTMLEAPQAMAYRSPFEGNSTICCQTLCIGLPLITDKVFNHRATKVIATMGPSCWEPEKMCALLDAGISVARFDLSVGDLVSPGSGCLEMCGFPSTAHVLLLLSQHAWGCAVMLPRCLPCWSHH